MKTFVFLLFSIAQALAFCNENSPIYKNPLKTLTGFPRIFYAQLTILNPAFVSAWRIS